MFRSVFFRKILYVVGVCVCITKTNYIYGWHSNVALSLMVTAWEVYLCDFVSDDLYVKHSNNWRRK